MDISNSSVNATPDTKSHTNLIARIRRLKIQEDLLIQSIKKNLPTGGDDNEIIFIKFNLEFNKFLSGLRKSYIDIKHLFDDVKCTTNSQDILRNLGESSETNKNGFYFRIIYFSCVI